MSGKRNLIFLVVLTMLFNLSVIGCGKKSSPSQKPQSTSSSQKPKAPKSAEAILKDINSLIGELDKQNKSTNAPWMAQQTSSSQSTASGGGASQGSSSSAQGSALNRGSGSGGGKSPGGSAQGTGGVSGNSSGGSSGGPSGGGGSQTISPEQQKQQQWQKISMSLVDIHRKWNELEPDVIEAGLPASSLQGFEDALGRLTQSVSAQNTEDSLTAAIDLYDKYTAGIAQIFTLSTPPELYQVQYRTMAALAAANQQEWNAANDSMAVAMEPWGLLKAQAKNADQKLLGRCDYSLQDLKTAITSEDLDMVLIKGDIAQSNLKQLEKSLTSGGQGGQ